MLERKLKGARVGLFGRFAVAISDAIPVLVSGAFAGAASGR